MLTAASLQDSITLADDEPQRTNGDKDSQTKQQPPRPPRRDGKPSDPNHRPSRSKEDAMRARRLQAGGPRRPSGPSESPHKRSERRPRRNSDSSLLIDFEKPLTEEEKKARDARRREREKKSRPSRPSRKVDLIDQLDATSVYGFGGMCSDGCLVRCHFCTLAFPPSAVPGKQDLASYAPSAMACVSWLLTFGQQLSITTVHLTHATRTEIGREAAVLR